MHFVGDIDEHELTCQKLLTCRPKVLGVSSGLRINQTNPNFLCVCVRVRVRVRVCVCVKFLFLRKFLLIYNIHSKCRGQWPTQESTANEATLEMGGYPG